MLLTKKDICERWQITERTVNEYMSKGILTQVKGLSCIRFNEEHVRQIEGCTNEKVTRRERALELELQTVKNERDKLQSVLDNILYELAKNKLRKEV